VHSGSFAPLAPLAKDDAALGKSPRYPVQEVDIPHYGYAILFAKSADAALRFTLVMTASVTFSDYDGSLSALEKVEVA